MAWQDYVRVTSVEEALQQLDTFDGEGRIIAGGTDLILQLRSGEKKARCLIDISCVESLCHIREKEGRILIGACATHSEISLSPIIAAKAPVLSEACSQVGSPQIRNIGTVGGNIVNAQPAADSVIALMALDAVCQIESSGDEKVRPINQLFLGPGVSDVDSTREILTEIAFDALGPSEGSAFYRLARRKGATLPTLNCAVCLSWNREKRRIERIRIAMGPVGPVPTRLYETEKVLTSDTFSDSLMDEALMTAYREANPRSSLRGGKEYRQEMTKVILRRALLRALRSAGCENGESQEKDH